MGLGMISKSRGWKRGHLHDRVHSAAVPLPHAPKAGLATNIPELHRHVPLGDLAHVKANSGDHVLCETAILRRREKKKKQTSEHESHHCPPSHHHPFHSLAHSLSGFV